MDVQLQELIDKIKLEGIKSAEQESARVLKEAEHKANDIIAAAHKEASGIISSAKEEVHRFEQTAKEAVQQAGRNTILSLRTRITELFDALIAQETKEALSPKVLEEAVVSLIKAWSKEQTSNLQVLLSSSDLKKVEKQLKSRLAAELKKGVELKPFPELRAGFRIAMKDGSAYYNFTDQGIAEILAEYLNPKIAEIVQDAAKKEN
ncbi:MAG: V-type ATP synthase subunit E [Spirochaetaceae bacterium]|nr:MAG: V-type ATP synthase subunit E [Spirochaetaceae bacterium]